MTQSQRVKENKTDMKNELISLSNEGQTLQAKQQIIFFYGSKLWESQSRFNPHNVRTRRELNALEKLENITAKLNAVKRILKNWNY